MKLTQLLATVLTLSVANILPSCSGSSEDLFADVDLIPVQLEEDGKWSMMNDKGEIVYEDEFDNEPSMAVNGYFSVEEKDGYTLYKANDKKPEPVEGMEELKYVGAVADGLVPATKENARITVMKPSGKVAFELSPCQGKEIVGCDNTFREGMLIVMTEDGKVGYYDKSGKMVIKPEYDAAYQFNEGLALVSKSREKSNGETEQELSIIDKKGNEVFKLKKGMEPIRNRFIHGYLAVEDNERILMFDKKGESKKLPSKIKSLTDYNGKYIIFENKGRYGVCDFEGEILIRAKYDQLWFNNNNGFFARKNASDDEILLLNDKGEASEQELDYKHLACIGHFGYIAGDYTKHELELLGKDFKPKSKDEFYSVGGSQAACWNIRSDYFDMEGAVRNMMNLINGNKVGGIALNTPASTILSGKEPSAYTYLNNVTLEDMSKSFYRYNINVEAYFPANISYGEWDSNTYNYNYYWNPEAKVYFFAIGLNSESEWGDEGAKALLEALKKDGYKVVVQSDNERKVLVKKGNILIEAISDENQAAMLVVDATIPNIEESLTAEVKGEQYIAPEEVVETEVDSIA